MGCDPIKHITPQGEVVVGFACGPRPRGPRFNCQSCLKRPSGVLCDYPVGHGKTCSKHLCVGCAIRVGSDCYICPNHPRTQIQRDQH